MKILHSSVAAKLALHLPLRQSQGFKVKGSGQFVTFASRPATNLSNMKDSFSTISAAAHVLTSWIFARVVLNFLNKSDFSRSTRRPSQHLSQNAHCHHGHFCHFPGCLPCATDVRSFLCEQFYRSLPCILHVSCAFRFDPRLLILVLAKNI